MWRTGRRVVAWHGSSEAGTGPARLCLPDDAGWRLVPDPGGALDRLQAEPLAPSAPAAGEIRVAVTAAGLNFHDVLVALSVLDAGSPLGGETCGRVVAVGPDVAGFAVGDRVVGFAPGAFASESVMRADLAVKAPLGFSAAELATVPAAFATATLALDLAGIGAGDRILVHAGAGGVGQAAIQLAQSAGAEVIATASTPKRAYLRLLGVEHVFDSRTAEFAEGVLEATGQAGVTAVLNSLTGPGFVEASLSCLREGGRFVEIGKRDIWSSEEMAAARPDVVYRVLAVDRLTVDDPATVGAALRRVMQRIESSELKPLSYSTWPMAEAGAAMEFMRSGRHIGKIVLTVPPIASGRLRADGTYLVTGGLGGIGRLTAGWLADRGARTIVLNGRREPDDGARQAIAALRERGVTVRVETADVTDSDAVDSLIERIEAELPPLAGVIHSAGVLSDGSLANQGWDRFETVLWPKVLGAWQLHRVTATRDLDLFVLFSGMAGVLGERRSGEPRGGERLPRPARAASQGLGVAGPVHRLERLVGPRGWRGGAGSHRGPVASRRRCLDDAAAGTGGVGPNRSRGCPCRCGCLRRLVRFRRTRDSSTAA